MLVRRISTLVFTIVLVSVTIMPSAEEDPSLDNPDLNQEDSDRFDADGDGTLSQEEKEIMFEAMALEVFTGQKLSRQDLRGMSRGRGGRETPPASGFGSAVDTFVNFLPRTSRAGGRVLKIFPMNLLR